MNVFKVVKASSGKLAMKLYTKAPKLMTVASIVGFGFTVYEACKAVQKMDEVMSEPSARIENVKNSREEMTEKEYRKEITMAYGNFAFEAAKLWAPTVIMGSASVCANLYAHNMMEKRVADGLASIAAIEESFREYRSRVIKRFGEEADQDIVRGYETVTVDVPELDKNGNPKKDKEGNVKSHQEETKVRSLDFVGPTRCFDAYCQNYLLGNNSYNASYIVGIEDAGNAKLHSRGYVWENEIWEKIGLPISETGCKQGCFYDPFDPEHHVNRIDLGIRKWFVNPETGEVGYEFTEEFKAFERGETDTLWLTLKTDGDICKYLFSSGTKKNDKINVKTKNTGRKLKRILPGLIEVYA